MNFIFTVFETLIDLVDDLVGTKVAVAFLFVLAGVALALVVS